MTVKVDFCFEIAEEAWMAKDMATGEPAKAYTRVSFEAARPPQTQEQYAEIHEDVRHAFSRMTGIALEHLRPITLQEYMEKAGTEEDEE